MPRAKALLPACVIAVAAAYPASARDLDVIKARGTLRAVVCETAAQEFYNVGAAGEPGFDREILESFAKIHHLRLEASTVPTWGDLETALLADRADVIAGHYSDTPERRKKLAFTGEVFPTRAVILSRAPGLPVTNWTELTKRRVGTTRGTSHYEALVGAGFPAAQLVMVPADRSARIQALRTGQITAAPFGVAEAMLMMREDDALQLGMFVGPPSRQAFGVRTQDRELLKVLNDHVASIRRSPRWGQLVIKYFGARALAILKMSREES